MAVEALLTDAFAQLGIVARAPTVTPDEGLELDLDVNGVQLAIYVKRRALVDGTVAERALKEPGPSDATLLIVGDRVTEDARGILTAGGAGYYDLRGRLALRARGLVVDAEVTPLRERPQRAGALRGKAGLEVACALLLRPGQGTAVRELARRLRRSASTVSEILSALRNDGLVDEMNAVTDSRLFWQLVDHWATPRVHLSQLPPPGDISLARALRLGLEEAESGTGWALTASAAAAAYGAPVAFRSGQILDFYVPDQAVLRRAMTLLGVAPTSALAHATICVAPAPVVVQSRLSPAANPLEWPLAHPLFVALDLAQDPGRGREILDAWTPTGGWPRVW
ncbi:ArsR family transcriptional regulator [Catenuloplanes sp. NPDC051500]|uniref:ArsR family transcriptional regulator n=1 Tax=Catenuloplanes sp. NPDC051500 TaxID=3363959 RepID=UPI00379E4A7A